MTYGQLEEFRKASKLTFDQMDNLLKGIDIRDIETILYNAKENIFEITIRKDRYKL